MTRESIDGLRNVNHVAAEPMPKVSLDAVEEILARDSFSLLGMS